MTKNDINGYLAWITPSPGDPTYSVLKAHLLFEELLNAYLSMVLPHPEALKGARLSFAQTLAIARASSTSLKSDDWMWHAVSELNKLRNLFAHKTRPKNLTEKIDAYVTAVTTNIKAPLPKPNLDVNVTPSRQGDALYTAIDMANVGLYYGLAARLGFRSNEPETASDKAHAGQNLDNARESQAKKRS